MQISHTSSTQPDYTATRVLAPDLARGMMLLFIAVANVSAYLWGQNTVGITAHPSGEDALSTALSTLVILFVDGHVYPMFAFLFGYGISQFAYSRMGRGIPAQTVGRMLLRRHLWLLAFGAVHALLLFGGDILGAYALTGLALSAVLLRAHDRALRLVLWIGGAAVAGFMLLSVLVLATLGFILPETFVAPLGDASGFEDGVPGVADLMGGISSYWLAMLARMGLWVVSSAGAVLTLVVPLMVLLGGFAARYRWLERGTKGLPLGGVAAWGITIGAIGALPAALDFLGVWPPNQLVSGALVTLAQLGGIAGGIGYVALFGWLGSRPGAHDRRWMKAVASVGKRSLSFYLLQSLVFAPLLSAWGFGLGATISTSFAYALALAVWVVSLVLAVWLEQTGRRGPAETLLRRLTYRTQGE
jgi:uncharacterized protein